MRVSIVATALDGQQPESKSVINMVHRIQNRNPGYYDVSAMQKNNNLNNNANFLSSTSGANALQVENENIKESENELLNSMVDENMAISNLPENQKESEIDNTLVLDTETQTNIEEKIDHDSVSENLNGLENFELGDDSPQLFNSDNDIINETKKDNFNEEKEEDELEIPAFLRRQKN